MNEINKNFKMDCLYMLIALAVFCIFNFGCTFLMKNIKKDYDFSRITEEVVTVEAIESFDRGVFMFSLQLNNGYLREVRYSGKLEERYVGKEITVYTADGNYYSFNPDDVFYEDSGYKIPHMMQQALILIGICFGLIPAGIVTMEYLFDIYHYKKKSKNLKDKCEDIDNISDS